MLVGRAQGCDRCETFAVFAQALAPELNKPRAQLLKWARVRHRNVNRASLVLTNQFSTDDEEWVLLMYGFVVVLAHLLRAFKEFRHVEASQSHRKETDRSEDREAATDRWSDLERLNAVHAGELSQVAFFRIGDADRVSLPAVFAEPVERNQKLRDGFKRRSGFGDAANESRGRIEFGNGRLPVNRVWVLHEMETDLVRGLFAKSGEKRNRPE